MGTVEDSGGISSIETHMGGGGVRALRVGIHKNLFQILGIHSAMLFYV